MLQFSNCIQDKFSNCIYFLEHNNAYKYNDKNSNKIGSSKILPSRMLTYKTYYPIDKLVVGYFYLDTYDCYQLDDDIKIYFNINRIKDSGGIEYYQDVSIEDLKKYFNERDIAYTFYNDHDYLNYNIQDFEKLITEGFQEHTRQIIRNQKYYNIIIQESESCNTNIILKNWQQDAIISYQDFYKSDDKCGLIIAPTGCGKSFLIMYITIIEYIKNTKNDAIIMTKRKEIFDKKFIDDSNKLINNLKLNIIIIDLINDDNLDYNIFSSNIDPNINYIFIINNDKFIASPRYNNFTNYSWNKIKLLILDECHWAGATLFHSFLTFMKDHQVDKIIGFSATPVRTAIENKSRSLDIFQNKDNEFNIIYQRSFIESIEQGDRVQNKWIIIPILQDGFDLDQDNSDLILENKVKKLNKIGIEYFLLWLNIFIIKSIRWKGILWFSSISSLKEFYDYVISIDINKFNNLTSILFLPTYSKTKIHTMQTSDNIYKFKSQTHKSILLAVMRGTEGFDDPTIDFGFNLYISNEPILLLDQQKEGRVSRTFETKEFGYYGFIVDKYDPNIKKIIAKRLGDWFLYINDFQTRTSSQNTRIKNDIITSNNTNYMDIIIDADNIIELNIQDITNHIQVYTDKININSSLEQIKKHIQKINKIRLLEHSSLIDTEEKYKLYAVEFILPIILDIRFYSNNWIKFLRPDYDELIELYLKENDLIKILKNQKFKKIIDIENFLIINKINPSYDYISNGFYNKNINFIDFLYIDNSEEII